MVSVAPGRGRWLCNVEAAWLSSRLLAPSECRSGIIATIIVSASLCQEAVLAVVSLLLRYYCVCVCVAVACLAGMPRLQNRSRCIMIARLPHNIPIFGFGHGKIFEMPKAQQKQKY